MSHIVDACPLTKFDGGLHLLHEAEVDTVKWPESVQRAQHSQNEMKIAVFGYYIFAIIIILDTHNSFELTVISNFVIVSVLLFETISALLINQQLFR